MSGSSGSRSSKIQRSGAQPSRIGGIALKNGVVLLTERYWAAAVRETDGHISVASGDKPRLSGSGHSGSRARGTRHSQGGAGRGAEGLEGRGVGGGEGVPLLRGLGRFGETLLVLAQVKIKLPHAELPLEGGRIVGALVGAAAATSAVKTLAPRSALIQETGLALAAFVPAVLALKNSSISGYHGAEHKVIGGREATLRSSHREAAAPSVLPSASSRTPVSASAAAAKEHDRCGSNLVGPYLLATVATNVLARGRSGHKSPAASAMAGAVSLGVALEALRWATRNGDSILARLLLLPGRAIQKTLTTTEPSYRATGGGGAGAGRAAEARRSLGLRTRSDPSSPVAPVALPRPLPASLPYPRRSHPVGKASFPQGSGGYSVKSERSLLLQETAAALTAADQSH